MSPQAPENYDANSFYLMSQSTEKQIKLGALMSVRSIDYPQFGDIFYGKTRCFHFSAFTKASQMKFHTPPRWLVVEIMNTNL